MKSFSGQRGSAVLAAVFAVAGLAVFGFVTMRLLPAGGPGGASQYTAAVGGAVDETSGVMTTIHFLDSNGQPATYKSNLWTNWYNSNFHGQLMPGSDRAGTGDASFPSEFWARWAGKNGRQALPNELGARFTTASGGTFSLYGFHPDWPFYLVSSSFSADIAKKLIKTNWDITLTAPPESYTLAVNFPDAKSAPKQCQVTYAFGAYSTFTREVAVENGGCRLPLAKVLASGKVDYDPITINSDLTLDKKMKALVPVKVTIQFDGGTPVSVKKLIGDATMSAKCLAAKGNTSKCALTPQAASKGVIIAQ